ncbi:LAMI_0C09318g1_1 [Lachancea mirantina]|uniref:LAMI_0C09318g1_1 n=1 Tax=Lachancea mirantina TaxID=1230905 RepID=A0A1G4J518_9SACH|nr:LAMI_0C09318g1_1 [Lachancea mirantina]
MGMVDKVGTAGGTAGGAAGAAGAANTRLPTLNEVLRRQSAAPADLWSFYVFLAQYPYAISFLDFHIDVLAHQQLCRDYVHGVRDSVRESSQLDPQGRDSYGSMSSSLLLEALLDDGFLDFEDSQCVSRLLQGDTGSARVSGLLDNWRRQSGRGAAQPLNEIVDQFLRDHAIASGRPRITSKQLLSNAQRIVATYLLPANQSVRYLINVPDEMRADAQRKVQVQLRHDPAVFDPIKTLAFDFLELDCFPKFLAAVALHNLHDAAVDLDRDQTMRHGAKQTALPARSRHRSPFKRYTSLTRVAIGLLWLAAAFWIGYVLIFLDYSRGIRVTTIVPFFMGCYCVVTGIYRLDILYAFCSVTHTLVTAEDALLRDSENGLDRTRADHAVTSQALLPLLFLLGGTGRLIPVRHPFIDSLLKKRAWWCLFLVLLGTAVFTVIFACVPGYRL